MKRKRQIPLLRTISIVTPCLKVKKKPGKRCPRRLNTQDHREEGHVGGEHPLIPLEKLQAGQYPTKRSVMRVQKKFVEEVSGDEEGVVAEVNQEGAKEEEPQVSMCFCYLHEHLNWTLNLISSALPTPNSTHYAFKRGDAGGGH